MNENNRHIGESRLLGKPKKPLHIMLKEECVKPEHLSEKIITEVFQPLLKEFTEDIQHQIDAASQHGIAVSNEFGTDEYISVSQKTLTDAFNKIWNKIEDITGEPITGIIMTVTPGYFISEDGADVHITARCAEEASVFEKLSFYINGSLLSEVENTDFYETDTHISETSVIKCVAKIMGIEYERSQVVTHHSSFFLGAGNDYSDVMDVEHTIPITNGMRGKYDVTCEDGDHIIVVVGDTLKEGFIRADINGFEIPFTETTVTVNNTKFKVFTSVNTYSAGTYNIDING
jgi:hypothetical protein